MIKIIKIMISLHIPMDPYYIPNVNIQIYYFVRLSNTSQIFRVIAIGEYVRNWTRKHNRYPKLMIGIPVNLGCLPFGTYCQLLNVYCYKLTFIAISNVWNASVHTRISINPKNPRVENEYGIDTNNSLLGFLINKTERSVVIVYRLIVQLVQSIFY